MGVTFGDRHLLEGIGQQLMGGSWSVPCAEFRSTLSEEMESREGS
jgi:hypothetical protein